MKRQAANARPGPRYVYSFRVWPAEHRDFEPAMYRLFRMLDQRIHGDFTEAEFDQFRAALSAQGLRLREVHRVPFFEPEWLE